MVQNLPCPDVSLEKTLGPVRRNHCFFPTTRFGTREPQREHSNCGFPLQTHP